MFLIKRSQKELWSSDIIRMQLGGREIFETLQADIFLTSDGSDEVGIIFYTVVAKIYQL